MNSLDYRLKEFFPRSGKPVLLVDTSAGLALGTFPGLEDFSQAAGTILSLADGIVCSPGQIRRIVHRTRSDAALLVRADWTNTLRGPNFSLPPQTPHYLPILSAQDALELGASALVASFLLGYPENIDGACLKNIVQLSMTGKTLGLPLLVEVRPTGPGVLLPGKAIELGASYALESGADAVIVPYPGLESLRHIATMLSIPWLLKSSSTQELSVEWEQAASLGASGIWIDHSWLASLDFICSILRREASYHE